MLLALPGGSTCLHVFVVDAALVGVVSRSILTVTGAPWKERSQIQTRNRPFPNLNLKLLAVLSHSVAVYLDQASCTLVCYVMAFVAKCCHG